MPGAARPPREHEWVFDKGLVDQIVVDCTPEPATLSLLALGGLLMTRRRR